MKIGTPTETTPIILAAVWNATPEAILVIAFKSTLHTAVTGKDLKRKLGDGDVECAQCEQRQKCNDQLYLVATRTY